MNPEAIAGTMRNLEACQRAWKQRQMRDSRWDFMGVGYAPD